GIDGRQGQGQGAGLAAAGPDDGVGPAELVGDACGSEPGGAGASSPGQEQAAQQQGEAAGGAEVEHGGQASEAGGQQGGEVREWHGRLLDTRPDSLPSSCSRGRLLSTCGRGS